MDHQQDGSAARDIRSGGTRARLEALEHELHETRQERDWYRQTVVRLAGGKPPEPPPAEFVTAWDSTPRARFEAVTVNGETRVISRPAIAISKRAIGDVWADLIRSRR